MALLVREPGGSRVRPREPTQIVGVTLSEVANAVQFLAPFENPSLQSPSRYAMNLAVHHDLELAFNCRFRHAVAGIGLGVGDEKMGSVKHAGRAYIYAPATPAGVNHRDRGQAVSHGRQYSSMANNGEQTANIVLRPVTPVPNSQCIHFVPGFMDLSVPGCYLFHPRQVFVPQYSGAAGRISRKAMESILGEALSLSCICPDMSIARLRDGEAATRSTLRASSGSALQKQ